MTGRRSSPDLGPNVEAALAGFPFPERDWEKDAAGVEAQIAAGAFVITDASLLATPLPSEPGEPSAPPSATSTPPAHSSVRTQSLADMARRSVENKQAAEREMARESLALASKRPNALEVQALREVMNSKLPAAAPQAAPSVPIASAPDSRRAATVPPARSAALSPQAKFAVGAALIALAAGALFWLRQPTPIPLVSAGAPGHAELKTEPTPNATPSTNNAPLEANPGVPSGVDPSSLPEAAATVASTAHDKPTPIAGAHAPAVGAPAAGPHADKIELAEDAPSAVANVAAAAVPAEQKTLPPDPALRPADSTGGAVPEKPSVGAVQAALGTVMSGARHCVAGDEGPSSAVVVFASDGHVQSVSVGGAAAGKPASACIEAQLGRARVQPFAASSFSISTTVRPD